MATLSFDEARQCVIETVMGLRTAPSTEAVPLEQASGRVLAEALPADRDMPAVARSVRDGFAVRASDTPGRLLVAGESRAGAGVERALTPGECLEIMTGAQVPRGADAVVMVEHAPREGSHITVPRAEPGQFINPQGSEARAGSELLPAGRRIGFAEIALLAAAGRSLVNVFRRPRVAILPTGDEIVDLEHTPEPHQVRNSNAWSLAAQVRRAGGEPMILPIARDDLEATRALIAQALISSHLLLLSGGVSAGKYDLVEPALAGLGAEFFFDRVRIQPGQPLVFARAGKTVIFGLPGNPVSTMVTFEVLARAALELLAGQAGTELPFTLAKLTGPFRHKPGLTRFLPARLAPGAQLTPVAWQGSGDLAALGRANAFLVADADRESWEAGELMKVLPR